MTRQLACFLALLASALLWGQQEAAAGERYDPGKSTFQRFQTGPPTFSPAPAEKPKPKSLEPDGKAKETAAAIRAQEEATLMRRMAVCDRLKHLALETGNTKLEEDAIRLEQRATEVFRERIRALSGGKSVAKDE